MAFNIRNPMTPALCFHHHQKTHWLVKCFQNQSYDKCWCVFPMLLDSFFTECLYILESLDAQASSDDDVGRAMTYEHSLTHTVVAAALGQGLWSILSS